MRRFSSSISVVTTLFMVCMFLSRTLCAQVTSTPNLVDFGSVAVRETSNVEFVFISLKPSATVGGVAAVSQGIPNFDYLISYTDCVPGQNYSGCVFEIEFRPQAPGPRNGALVLTDNSGNLLITVPLLGIGTAPMVVFAPGIMSTVVGGTKASSTVGLNYPNGVGVDAGGNVYVGDTGHNTVRKLSSTGATTTIAGGNGQGYSGDGGLATGAKLYYPTTVRLDGTGNIYITDDGNNAIRMINPAGIITTVAGLAPGASICAQATDQWGDGCPATQASLDIADSYYGEGGTATDSAGNLYIADTADNLIRKVGSDGTISIFAGTGTAGYSGDGGPATSAQLNNPDIGAFDSNGNLYVADLYNNVIRKITPDGTISTVAGTGTYGHTGDGGLATNAELGYPYQVAVDAAGDLYITDSGNFTEGDQNEVIRKVTPSGIITTVAGSVPSSSYSGDGGPATKAQMWGPVDVAVDGQGNLYIADDYNHAIRKVDVSDPPSLSFASIPVGSVSASQDVMIENLGNEFLSIESYSKVGTSFAIFTDPDTTCGSTGQTVQPATSCVLGFEFAPKVTGTINGSFTLTDSHLNQRLAQQTISLQGIAPVPSTTMIATSSASVELNQPVIFTATVASMSGPIPDGDMVAFKDATTSPTVTLGTTPLSGGVATFMTSSLALGAHTIKATYLGDPKFLPSVSTSFTETVLRYPSMTTLVSSMNPSMAGQAVTFTATVAGDSPTGTVTFSKNGVVLATVPLVSGQASITTTLASSGTKSINASYSGDPNNRISTSSVLSQVVN